MGRAVVLPAIFLLATAAFARGPGGEYFGPYLPRHRPDDSGGALRDRDDWFPPFLAPGEDGRDDPSPGSGRPRPRVLPDVLAYWPFWFEPEKELLLADRLRARRGGAGALREEHRERVLPVLLAALRDESGTVRVAAARAAGQWGGREVVAPLLARLRDPEGSVRREACLALGLTRDAIAIRALRALLPAPDRDDLPPAAALGLGLAGDPAATDALLEALDRARGRGDADLVVATAIALGALGSEDAVGAVGSILSTPSSPGTRVIACQALGRIGSEEAGKWLARALVDPSREVGAAAALALGALPRLPSREVRERLRGSGDRMTRLYGLLSLGRILGTLDSEAAKATVRGEIVRELRADPDDPYATSYAAFALALARDHAADDRLLEFLSRDRRRALPLNVRTAAIVSLGLLRVRESAPRLRAILADDGLPGDERGYAALALGLLGDPSARAPVREAMLAGGAGPALLRSGAWALGLLGSDADVDLLVRLLGDSAPRPPEVRFAAARALGILASGEAVEPLLARVRDGADDLERAFVIRALGYLGDPSPVDRVPALFAGLHHRAVPLLVSWIRQGR